MNAGVGRRSQPRSGGEPAVRNVVPRAGRSASPWHRGGRSPNLRRSAAVSGLPARHTSRELHMIVVTGATGKLGRHVIRGLEQRVPATELALLVRNPANVSGLAHGVEVRQGGLQPAGDPGGRAPRVRRSVLLISSSEVGRAPRASPSGHRRGQAGRRAVAGLHQPAPRGSLAPHHARGGAPADRGGHPRFGDPLRVPPQRLVPGELHRGHGHAR